MLAETLAVAALTIAAAALRLVMLTSFPPGFHGDEAWIGLEAQRILEDGVIGVWTPTAWGQPAGPVYWVAAVFRFFPDSVLTLRTSLALFGVATVPVFYLFARNYFGIRAALIGTALLTFSHWHIHYSRTAYPLISAPLLECAALLLLGIAMKRRTFPWFIAAGLIAGAGVYTYRSYLLFAVALVAVWGMIFLRRPYPLRRLAVHAASFALPAIIVALPMFLFIFMNYDEYTGYGKVASLMGNGEFETAREEGRLVSFATDEARRAVKTYYSGGLVDESDGMGGVGLLGPVAVALFAVGLVIAVFRWYDWRYLLLLVSVAIGLAAVAVTVEWGENRRGIIALPMVFAAIGLGGDALLRLGEWLLPRFRYRTPALYGVLAAALIATAVWNVRTYFWDEVEHPRMLHAYAYDLSMVSRYLNSMESDPYVYFYSEAWSWKYEARRFYAPGFKGEDRSVRFGDFKLDRSRDSEVLYVLMNPYVEYIDELKERYQGGKEMDFMDGDRLVFIAYWLEANVGKTASMDEPVAR